MRRPCDWLRWPLDDSDGRPDDSDDPSDGFDAPPSRKKRLTLVGAIIRRAVPSATSALLSLLRDKECLLVIDGVEALTAAPAFAELLHQLLQRTLHLRILLTSSTALPATLSTSLPAKVVTLRLAPLTPLDGARLFARRVGRPIAELLPIDAPPTLEALSQQPLLRHLGGHPEAIIRCAATVGLSPLPMAACHANRPSRVTRPQMVARAFLHPPTAHSRALPRAAPEPPSCHGVPFTSLSATHSLLFHASHCRSASAWRTAARERRWSGLRWSGRSIAGSTQPTRMLRPASGRVAGRRQTGGQPRQRGI